MIPQEDLKEVESSTSNYSPDLLKDTTAEELREALSLRFLAGLFDENLSEEGFNLVCVVSFFLMVALFFMNLHNATEIFNYGVDGRSEILKMIHFILSISVSMVFYTVLHYFIVICYFFLKHFVKMKKQWFKDRRVLLKGVKED